MTERPGVTVGRLLQSRPDTLGLDLEVLAGSSGLDRGITSPYVQKTGLALERGDTRHPSSREPRRRGLAEAWAEADDRLGLDEERYYILNLPLPLIRMPVASGRNLAILVLAGMDEPDELEIEDIPDAGEET